MADVAQGLMILPKMIDTLCLLIQLAIGPLFFPGCCHIIYASGILYCGLNLFELAVTFFLSGEFNVNKL